MPLNDEQTATIDLLKDPKTHGLEASDVTLIKTHISIVLLIGPRAFKLKRAVKLPYVDFSTAARRLVACYHEVELNRRTAPAIYLGVHRITAEPDGSLALDGEGRLIDAVVEMLRVDENRSFDRLAETGMLTPVLLTDTARSIARFHAAATVNRNISGAAIMANVLAVNAAAFVTTGSFASESLTLLNGALSAALDRHRDLLDFRAAAGKVRHCHGDLHLGNICLVDGVPTLFDCIEFDDAMATIDVLYDLAFLLMDLWHRGERAAANLVFNRYLDETDETGGTTLLPFFMAVRSSIRAHVLATQRQMLGATGDDIASEAKKYLDLAQALLAPRPARLVAIGGLSGTGKSTIAAMIADRIGEAPGARVLASDRIRKRFYHVSPETRLSPEAYCSAISEKVYAIQASEASAILTSGHAALAEAVFDREADRDRIENCALDANVSFTGICLEAPTEVLLKRVGARSDDASDASDASDATADTVRLQARTSHRKPLEWTEISAREAPASVAASVLDALEIR